MTEITCRQDSSLTTEERAVFLDHLRQQEMSDNALDLFSEWVARSSSEICFFYLKVYRDTELIGLGLFLKMKPFDLRSSYSGLRKSAFFRKLGGMLSAMSSNCVYISFRNLVTSNLTRPFFYKNIEAAEEVMKAILTYLRTEKEADMVSIIDTSDLDQIYSQVGFCKYPSPSEAYLDATRYADISEYLADHRSLKKNLARRKSLVSTTIVRGPVSGQDKEQMKACVHCSVVNSQVNNPCQQFFEDNIFETKVFDSDDYIHILVRVEAGLAGFHTFLLSGSCMGGVLGGFNREHTKGAFAYERVIVASLDYAIKNKYKRVHYSLIDNKTKLRLVESTQACGLYFFSSSALNRTVFKRSYKYSDINKLHMLEQQSDHAT